MTMTTARLPEVDKVYRTSVASTGRARRECWSATTRDGRWTVERLEDVGTPWVIVNATETVPALFGTLRGALIAISTGQAARLLNQEGNR